MITPITATFPALNFPKESDYPTQNDWAAFSAAAELNYGILSGTWSDKSEEFKAQTNNLALQIQDIGANAISAITLDTVDDLATYAGTGLVMVKDLNRGGTFIYDDTQSAVNNGGTIFDGWVRQYSGAVNVKWFGAVGDWDGTTGTDDTVAIKMAILHGRNVTIENGIFYIKDGIAFSTQDNIKVEMCNNSKIISTFRYVFSFSGSNNISFKNMNIDQSNSTEAEHAASIYSRGSILFSNCNYVSVTNSKIFNGYNPAIALINTSNSNISENSIYNSLNSLSLTNNSLSSGGIYLVDSSKNNVIDSNIINNQGYGIYLQSVGDDTNTDNNTISNNNITNSYVYGLMGYIVNRQTSSSTCDFNTFSNNLIDTVYGNVINGGSGALDFGAGIYLQQARNNSVIGNTFKNTNVYTTGGTLNPSSIAISYGLNTLVSGNSIIDFNGGGLNIFNSDNAHSGIVITGNKFINTKDKLHMRVIASGVTITGNSFFYEGTSVGVSYAILNNIKYTGISYKDIAISGNIFNNLSGINIGNATDTIVDNNIINNCKFGIKFEGISDGAISNNVISPYVSDGKGIFIACAGHSKPTIVNGNSAYSNNVPSNYFVSECITNNNYIKYDTRVSGDYAEYVNLPAAATSFNGSNTKVIIFESLASTGDISTITKSSIIDLQYKKLELFTQSFPKTIKHTGSGAGGISLAGGVNAIIPPRSMLELTYQNSGSYWMETKRNF